MSLVSCIITTHNRLSLLPRAIDSVFTQSYPFIECIVVDDASEDGTEEYCRSRKEIQYIRIPKTESKGGNHARNVGIIASHGDYIAFLDDDDYWLPQKIEKQIKIASSKACGLVYCHRVLENDNDIESTINTISSQSSTYVGDVRRSILQTCCICTTSTMLVAKQTLIASGLFDETLRYWQEYELTIRLAQITNFEMVNEALVVYHNVNNDTKRLTNNYQGWPEAVSYILEKHRQLFLELSLKDFLSFQYVVSVDASHRNKLNNQKELEKENRRILGISQVLTGDSHSWRMTIYYLPIIVRYLPQLYLLWKNRQVYIA